MKKSKCVCRKCGKVKTTNKKKMKCVYIVPGVYETFDDPFLNNENVIDILSDKKVLEVTDNTSSEVCDRMEISIDSRFTNTNNYDKELFEGMMKIVSIVSDLLRYNILELPNLSLFIPNSLLTNKGIMEEINLIKILSNSIIIENKEPTSHHGYVLKINIGNLFEYLNYTRQGTLIFKKYFRFGRIELIDELERLLDSLISPATKSVSILIHND